MEAALIYIVPRILNEYHFVFDIRVFQGKPDLLKKLPQRLPIYRHYDPSSYRIVVVVDRDQDDCIVLKNKLETIATKAGLTTKTSLSGRFMVLNRVAIEELEAWFFGDVEAIRAVYPRVPASLGEQAMYRDPDAISGGTAERLEKLLQDHNYHPSGLEKVRAATEISQHMVPDRNRSKSFQAFRDALRDIFR